MAEPKKRNWTLRISITLIVIILTVALLPSVLVLLGVVPVSQGARVGVVNKLSDKGYLSPSTEGILFMAGDAAGLQGNTWAFSVVDPNVKQMVKDAMDSQQHVRLEYKEYHTVWGRTNTNYHITNVIQLKHVTQDSH